jgi:hypothetical protein
MSRPVRALVCVVLIGLGTAAVASRVTSLSESELARNDLTQDYLAAKAWTHGGDPYAPTAQLGNRYLHGSELSGVYTQRRDPHPPAQILLVAPLSAVPFRTARVVWMLLNAICAALAGTLFARRLGAPTGLAVASGIGALAIPVVQQDLVYGQTGGIILLAMMAAWLSLDQERPVLGGLSLGFAAAIKLFPALLIIPLLRMGKRRTAAWSVGAAVGVSVVTAAVLGAKATETFLTVAAPQNTRFWRSAPMNVSAVSIPFRWLTRSAWRPNAPDLPGLAAALALVVFVGCLIAAARTKAGTTGDLFWAAAPLMVLATPLAWSFTLMLALPTAALLVRATYRDHPLPAALIATVLAVGVLPGLPAPGQGDAWPVVVFGFALPTYALASAAAIDFRARSAYSL